MISIQAVVVLVACAAASESWSEWAQRKAAEAAAHAAVQAAAGKEAAGAAAKRMAFVKIDTPALRFDNLVLPYICAQLSWTAYSDTEDDVVAQLSDINADLKLIHFHRQQLAGTDSTLIVQPQWFAAAMGASLFITFRGTYSADDAFRDLVALPTLHSGTGCEFHRGFLDGVAQSTELHELLKTDSVQQYADVYVTGHSLGGALATTLVATGSLRNHKGQLHVLTFGSPAVLHGSCDAGWLEKAEMHSFVYGADIVPRLLGSDLPLIRAMYAKWGPYATKGLQGDTLSKAEKGMDVAEMQIATFSDYVQPSHMQLYWIDPSGKATLHLVPAKQQRDVLHIHQGLGLSSLSHHGMYLDGLRKAMAVAMKKTTPAKAEVGTESKAEL